MWYLIPVKSLYEGKSRLSSVLDPRQRETLNRLMLEDLLSELVSTKDLEGITIVSDDGSLGALAAEYSASLSLLEDGSAGINADLEIALSELTEQGIKQVCILPADLLTVSAGDFDSLVAFSHCHEGRAIITPCKNGTGTNALVSSLPIQIPLAYGDNSFLRHCEELQNSGQAYEVFENKSLAFDLDTVEDLQLIGKEVAVDSRAIRFIDSLGLLEGGENRLALETNHDALVKQARTVCQDAYGDMVTYSRKVFIPLTRLCRDVCHYCTFATTPKNLDSPYLDEDEVLERVLQAKKQDCKEVLFTLGEKPELRYSAARKALEGMGYDSTVDYVEAVARKVLEQTGLLPHINLGCMNEEEMRRLRKVSASMGLMLESSSPRLCEEGQPHYGSPDKDPAVRLATIELAGKLRVPFTTGILIGIGETRLERVESLQAIRQLHDRYGHIQEVIIQNFRAKDDTKMSAAEEPGLEELQWTIAVARLVFGPSVSVQAPPNLSSDSMMDLLDAGINDWGGISPVSPDYVNPESPWPHLRMLAQQMNARAFTLQERLTVYPEYTLESKTWLDEKVRPHVLELMDGQGLAREDNWRSGGVDKASPGQRQLVVARPVPGKRQSAISGILQKLKENGAGGVSPTELRKLFEARGQDFSRVCFEADQLRSKVNGDEVTYVTNRNINYTNICMYKCQFCAFSKSSRRSGNTEAAYNMEYAEIQKRCIEAAQGGATEVCLQGGIHPRYDGNTYLDICRAIKEVTPELHIHAFSPLEVTHGAETLGLSIRDFLMELKAAGLSSLPGTAAEILNDYVREDLCHDKVNTREWLNVMEQAHSVGLKSTATIMFGHIDGYDDWVEHLLHIRNLQKRTGGFTEFVPLPFVARHAPIYRRGKARPGPTYREAILMHAVARLVLHPHITNIQGSWVKMGESGLKDCMRAGVNDMGGTLTNETITRAAGAAHGQNVSVDDFRQWASELGRPCRQRTTLYGYLDNEASGVFGADWQAGVNDAIAISNEYEAISFV